MIEVVAAAPGCTIQGVRSRVGAHGGDAAASVADEKSHGGGTQ
jgi:hypothetical protein